MRILFILITLIIPLSSYAQVKVKGYYRKDGTYVKPHYRSSPDGNPYNNYSYPGNTNPYTGKTATGNPDTYLKNYYNRSSSSSSSNNSSNYSKPSTTYSNGNNYSNRTYSTTNYVTANSLNVRSGPSVNYNKVGALSYSDNVSVAESYSNGWKKIKYSYYDYNSWTFKTKTGYVASKYLSSSNPMFKDYNISTTANTYNYSSSKSYSSIKKKEYPYGYGNGALVVWTNCGTDGEIKIYLNDIYIGKLTKYFSDGQPDYGDSGTLTLNKKAGTYRLKAKGSNNVWEGTITIAKDRCLIQGLDK